MKIFDRDLLVEAVWSLARLLCCAAVVIAWMNYGLTTLTWARAFLSAPTVSDPVIVVVIAVILAYWLGARPLLRRQRVQSSGVRVLPGFALGVITPNEDLARHEAGHAVVGTLLGGEVVRISANWAETTGETVTNFPGAALGMADEAWMRMRITLAGRLAERAEVGSGGAWDDVRNALHMAVGIVAIGQRPAGYDGELTVDSLISTAQTEVAALLRDHDDLVQHICRGLMDSRTGTLTGAALRILEGHRSQHLGRSPHASGATAFSGPCDLPEAS